MAHPKSKISKMRKRKRRTHYKAAVPTAIATCSVTGEKHLRHRTYTDVEGNVYYRGKMVIQAAEEDV